jgi:L-lactate dehydrogenase complex protein LldG
MEESTSREKILKKVRNALLSKSENPFPSLDLETSVYQPMEDSLDVTFAKEFSKVAGKFIYCENKTELINNLVTLIADNNWKKIHCTEPGIKNILDEAGIPFNSDEENFTGMDAGITYCEYLIARLGSIMVSSRQISGRRLTVFPESHLVIANASQIVPDIKDALKKMQEKYNNQLPSLITVITGPSRTADIEKTLVMGAHGPKQLFLFLIDEV